ncbi:MAG: exopolysaccharide biosynthesis polyprenyl glycosylphosphotransferase [Acetobacteraceae bacterium]|nr:exopolysaccharide biosynthesis polyprenyl glycosylphosphotransferase [Acetobacteraceae bacterium]
MESSLSDRREDSFMARILAHYVTTEMALLGLFELVLSFLLIDAMLMVPGLTTVLSAAPAGLFANGSNLAAILALTIGAIAATIGLYRPEALVDRNSLLLNATVAGLAAFPAELLIIGSTHLGLSGADVLWLAAVLTAWLACILVTRLAVSRVLDRTRFARRVLVVGTSSRALRLCETLRNRRFWRFQPILAGGERMSLTPQALREQRIWGVVLADQAESGPVAEALRSSKLSGVRVYDDTRFYEHHLGRIDLDTIDANWFITTDGFDQTRLGQTAKRATDIAVSLLLLLLACPLMAITALLIKLEGPGPVFYRQKRTGLRGVPFTVFKFRSMTVDAEAGGDPRWAQRQDPRVTRIGSIIRPMRIDELPQLINVLRGEMSMIGPRPERPHFVEQLCRIIPFYHERSCVKPGLTGWAQVNFPYGASVEDAREKLAYDLYYVKNRNLLLDLLILLSTVRVVLFREGAR